MNSDVLVTPNWLNSYLNCANDFSHWKIIGSRLIYPNDTIQHAGIGYRPNPYMSSEFENYWEYLPYHPKRGMNKNDKSCLSYREMAGVTTALAMFNMDVFTKIGCFDEKYSPGIYDDPDFCLTAISQGYIIGYCPHVVAFHLEGKSFDKDKINKMRILERNAKYFLLKWEPWLSKLIRPKYKYSEWGSYTKYKNIY
jgi:GT2 family glycosyltransferase